ncbi:hypothetical protein GQ55_9G279900 [Panicum hallii var. hallii]|uniref:Uncharacterized protein n=1 Tax=Panicum hallii var. hallii TaxID=1504633 RepID=A0A2T7C7J5_9POAL|nr:hypothetical protein GQ55_9G279900 [Panicum hallii var. hallii]
METVASQFPLCIPARGGRFSRYRFGFHRHFRKFSFFFPYLQPLGAGGRGSNRRIRGRQGGESPETRSVAALISPSRLHFAARFIRAEAEYAREESGSRAELAAPSFHLHRRGVRWRRGGSGAELGAPSIRLHRGGVRRRRGGSRAELTARRFRLHRGRVCRRRARRRFARTERIEGDRRRGGRGSQSPPPAAFLWTRPALGDRSSCPLTSATAPVAGLQFRKMQNHCENAYPTTY